MEQAYVSLTTNDQYSLGAYVLGESLRKSGTKRRLVLMVTSGVSEVFREKLRSVWDELIDITLLESKDKENLTLLERPELACTFSKLCAWTLIQFKKCVFLDADTLVIQNVDELFDREELSAAADIGWPDCFNSGVFVFCPSMETYESLVMCAKEKGSFDGGDQGLLNEFFNWWPTRDITYRLPFTYNMVSNVCYSYAPAYRRFGKDVKIVHFLGSIKPWHHSYDASTGKVTPAGGSRYCGPDERFIQMWWDCCVAKEASSKAGNSVESHKAYASETRASAGDEARGFEGREVRSSRESWERGTVDYSGEDSFANILAHISGLMIGTERATNQAPGRLADPAPERLGDTAPERLADPTPERLADPTPERLADPAPERLADPAPDQMPK